MADSITVVGMDRAKARLGALWSGMPLAMLNAGQAVQAEMQMVARTHHYHGDLERGIHVEVSGAGLQTEARVGISTRAVPEGRPLAFGWSSTSGKQPPVDAIARWLASKPEAAAGLTNAKGRALVFRTSAGRVGRRGLIEAVAGQASIRSRAFLIARAIGRRGYSFGKADWFHEGIKAARPRIRTIVVGALGRGSKA